MGGGKGGVRLGGAGVESGWVQEVWLLLSWHEDLFGRLDDLPGSCIEFDRSGISASLTLINYHTFCW